MSRRAEMAKRWGKWAGIVAFLFFLLKGLAWLGVFAGLWYVADR
jgi:CHASE1-domain containing sensor protein